MEICRETRMENKQICEEVKRGKIEKSQCTQSTKQAADIKLVGSLPSRAHSLVDERDEKSSKRESK